MQKTTPIVYCLGSTCVLLAWQENGPQQLVMGLSDHSLHSEGSLSEAVSFYTEIETLFDGVGVPGVPGGFPWVDHPPWPFHAVFITSGSIRNCAVQREATTS